jgi:hypothetical protein
MTITVFEGYSVGKIERGVPLPVETRKPLSLDKKRLLQLEGGESLVLRLRIDDFSTGSARRLAHWARLRGIRIYHRRIDEELVQIWRTGAV